MTWYHLPLTEAQVAAGELECRRDEFAAAFKAADAPRMMALFQKERPGGGLDLYLTPECGEHAAPLLKKWQCLPCDRPAMAGMDLVVGFNEITYYLV